MSHPMHATPSFDLDGTYDFIYQAVIVNNKDSGFLN
jgi:hypothetical protein